MRRPAATAFVVTAAWTIGAACATAEPTASEQSPPVASAAPSAGVAGPASVVCQPSSPPAESDASAARAQPPPGTPVPRANQAMTWDEQRRELVMFGGLSYALSSVSSETWTWTTAGWCRHFPEHSPPPRAYANLAFDRSNNVVVLFGGLSQGQPPITTWDDTWTWNGVDWTLRQTAHHPNGRTAAGFAFSDTLGRLVLVGGGREGNTLTDTWTWDGSDWTQLTTPLMTAGAGEVLGYQKSTGNLVMLSGLEVYGEGLEVWIFDGHAWRTTEHLGPELKWSAAAWDTGRSEFVIFGGADTTGKSQSSTMVWDGNWNIRPTASSPPASGSQSFYPGMAWDPVDGMAILFGGRDDVGHYPTGTWGWDGSDWKLLSD